MESTAHTDANLVANPGFEEGSITPANWNFVTNNDNTPIWSTTAHSGGRSVQIRIRGTTDKISGYPKSELIRAQPLLNYTFSAWGKTRYIGGTGRPVVRVVELDASKKWIKEASLNFGKGTNNWAQKKLEFQTDSQMAYLYVYANIWNGYGNFWVDDIIVSAKEITPTPAPTATPTPAAENTVGGGTGYTNIINPANANFIVKNKAELLSALSSAVSGNVIYVTDTAQIDLTGERELIIPSGVTLASGRGNGDSPGARLYLDSNVYTRPALFKVGGDGVRITGLRIEGADGSETTCTPEQDSYCIPIQAGIYSEHNVEIDNNEISKWSYTAITLVDTNLHIGTPSIHHNYIHHNTRVGLGYGISLAGNADAIAEYNLFDYNRHSIADEGLGTSSYIARYNTVLGHGIGHAFDMHGGDDREDGTNIAGKRIEIYGNTIHKITMAPYFSRTSAFWQAILIRGVPTEGAWIHDNYLYYDTSDPDLYGDKPIEQIYCVVGVVQSCDTYNKERNFNVYSNTFNGVYVP